MPAKTERRRGQLSNPEAYKNASKNMRRYVGVNERGELEHDSRSVLQQGLIKDEKQNMHNVEQIIKYLQGDRFKRWIEGIVEEAIKKLTDA